MSRFLLPLLPFALAALAPFAAALAPQADEGAAPVRPDPGFLRALSERDEARGLDLVVFG
jgi:hypothetical protein